MKPSSEHRRETSGGLSRETRKLWLAATHYRRVADLAASKVAP